ncbi:MAG: fumarylacetoacetate hydrolase family protein [Phycisphaeraceae bacterium]|nr:fumarylacetoacetate hydrolase family protein [Phycisphaeraceae bacterium]
MEIVRLEVGVGVKIPGGDVLPIRHIVGIGRNYAEHAAERGAEVPDRPMVFFKSPASTCLNEDPIVVPSVCRDPTMGGDQVDFEAELAVVIGRAARNVERASALEHVLGYCCANDVSARWWQKSGSGGQFCRGKSFDSFCPLGPRLIPPTQVLDPGQLQVTCRLNGETMQRDSTSSMIFDVPTLICELSKSTTLPAGTAILTGTPSGVGAARNPPRFLRPGDTVEVEIQGLGALRNPVVAE